MTFWVKEMEGRWSATVVFSIEGKRRGYSKARVAEERLAEDRHHENRKPEQWQQPFSIPPPSLSRPRFEAVAKLGATSMGFSSPSRLSAASSKAKSSAVTALWKGFCGLCQEQAGSRGRWLQVALPPDNILTQLKAKPLSPKQWECTVYRVSRMRLGERQARRGGAREGCDEDRRSSRAKP